MAVLKNLATQGKGKMMNYTLVFKNWFSFKILNLLYCGMSVLAVSVGQNMRNILTFIGFSNPTFVFVCRAFVAHTVEY